MMGKRHEIIGIKQAIRLEWLQKTANLVLSGMEGKLLRRELHEYLYDRKGNGSEGQRGETSRTQVVNMLMNIWAIPDPDLVRFRDDALRFTVEYPTLGLAVQWAMISAAYPFWFNVAQQVGRLLNLQDQVTQAQVFVRLKEQYGDRETVSRYARYVIRSFAAWGVLKDSEVKGCYKKPAPVHVADKDLAILMYEAGLRALPEGRSALKLLHNNPAYFPFQLPAMTGDYMGQRIDRIEVVRYGLDDELLKLAQK